MARWLDGLPSGEGLGRGFFCSAQVSLKLENSCPLLPGVNQIVEEQVDITPADVRPACDPVLVSGMRRGTGVERKGALQVLLSAGDLRQAVQRAGAIGVPSEDLLQEQTSLVVSMCEQVFVRPHEQTAQFAPGAGLRLVFCSRGRTPGIDLGAKPSNLLRPSFLLLQLN